MQPTDLSRATLMLTCHPSFIHSAWVFPYSQVRTGIVLSSTTADEVFDAWNQISYSSHCMLSTITSHVHVGMQYKVAGCILHYIQNNEDLSRESMTYVDLLKGSRLSASASGMFCDGQVLVKSTSC